MNCKLGYEDIIIITFNLIDFNMWINKCIVQNNKICDWNNYFLSKFSKFFPLETRIDNEIVFFSFFKNAFNFTNIVSFNDYFKQYFLYS